MRPAATVWPTSKSPLTPLSLAAVSWVQCTRSTAQLLGRIWDNAASTDSDEPWHNRKVGAELSPGLPIDVVGPVRAEVFVVAHDGVQAMLTGPDGPHAWHIETANAEHPLDLVRTMAASTMSDVLLVHSTSWRWDRQAVVLTFLVVVEPSTTSSMRSIPIVRSDLARSTAHEAPTDIGSNQVLEHALRHLAWLAKEDRVVGETLNQAWITELSTYVPSPFQQLE